MSDLNLDATSPTLSGEYVPSQEARDISLRIWDDAWHAWFDLTEDGGLPTTEGEEAAALVIANACQAKDEKIQNMERCLSFFRSMINGGEQWSETCDIEWEKAMGKPKDGE